MYLLSFIFLVFKCQSLRINFLYQCVFLIFYDSKRGAYNFTLTPSAPPLHSLRPREPQPMEPQLMGPQTREPKSMGQQPTDISLFESLGIEFYEALFYKLFNVRRNLFDVFKQNIVYYSKITLPYHHPKKSRHGI